MSTLAGVRIRSRTWQRPACSRSPALRPSRLPIGGARAVLTRRAAARRRRGCGRQHRRHLPPRRCGDAALATLCRRRLTFCTYAAGGADSSGYLNQARLFSHGRSVDESRLPGSWPDRHRQAGAARISSHARSPASRPDLPAWLSVVDGAGVPDRRTRAEPGRAALRRADGVVDVCAGAQARRAGGRRGGSAAGRRPVRRSSISSCSR